jgi:preprotein translocase subunit SecD
VVAFLYALPNFFGELPAVQVSPVRTTEKVDTVLLAQVESLLKASRVAYSGVEPGEQQHQGALCQHRYPDQGQGCAANRPGRALHGGAESGVGLAGLAVGDQCDADVSRPGPARRRALPARSRHEGALEKSAIRYQNDFRTELRSAKIRYGRISREGDARSPCASPPAISATKPSTSWAPRLPI